MSQTVTDALEQTYNLNYNKLERITGRKPEINSIHSFNTSQFSSVKIFGIIFTFILFLLIFLKPGSLVTYENENGTTKIDLYYLFQFTTIFSVIIFAVYKIP